MNKQQLLRLGVPEDCIAHAIGAIQAAARDRKLKKRNPKKILPSLVEHPESFTSDPHFSTLADAIIESRLEPTPSDPIEYSQWGNDIDGQTKAQMENACRLPVATAAALMPDAHVGYGLPIGGVLACDNAVIPYGVGVDIACRMKLTVTDMPAEVIELQQPSDMANLDTALEKGTRFGQGAHWKQSRDHDVMDEDWSITAVTREVKDRAWKQLGTSGSGNHFVEWGILELPQDDLGLEQGRYVALLSHSGSRGPGARVCQRYSDLAQQKLKPSQQRDKQLKQLAWLDLDSQAGQEYWEAMNLMGRYASANHEIIHKTVMKLAGAESLASIENHHNFAWEEEHHGKKWIVHRKGATPAGEGVLGVIPGNMADPAYIVRGKGNVESLQSASHGAGRRMSRSAAKQAFNWKMWRDYLAQREVRLLGAGIDEVPGAYKDIEQVMAAQSDLVETVGRFFPRIVMMCGDGSPAED